MKESINQPSAETTRSPEQGPSFEQKKRAVIEGLRDDYGILFITLVGKEFAQKMGISSDEVWFRDALGLDTSSKKLRKINPIEEALPDTVEESAIIIGGSPYSVYEKENEPWMQRMVEFIRLMHQRKKPMLGVCYGHQLIAHSFGGTVEKNPKGREFGSINVDLTEEGALDPLYEGVSKSFVASDSHQDVVSKRPDVEKTAVLVTSPVDEHHSFAIGETTRTVQFHPEIEPATLEQIANLRKELYLKEGFVRSDEEFRKLLTSFKKAPEAKSALHNFLVRFAIKA